MFVRKRTIKKLQDELAHAFRHIEKLDKELFTEVHPAYFDMFSHRPATPTTAGTINAILQHLDLDIKVKPKRPAMVVAKKKEEKK